MKHYVFYKGTEGEKLFLTMWSRRLQANATKNSSNTYIMQIELISSQTRNSKKWSCRQNFALYRAIRMCASTTCVPQVRAYIDSVRAFLPAYVLILIACVCISTTWQLRMYVSQLCECLSNCMCAYFNCELEFLSLVRAYLIHFLASLNTTTADSLKSSGMADWVKMTHTGFLHVLPAQVLWYNPEKLIKKTAITV